MQKHGFGTDGRIINNVTITAALPAATPGVASGIVELRDTDVFSLQIIARSLAGAFEGTLLIEASNNYAPSSGGTSYGQSPYAGDWTDVTALFSPTPVNITANGSQMIQPIDKLCGWRHLRVTVTRTAGTSVVLDVWVCGKGR